MQKRTGGCNCRQVTFVVLGDPVRTGFCHCQICRKETGSIGNHFAVWPDSNVTVRGRTNSWIASTDNRHFCPTCGSSVFSIVDGAEEVEIKAGALDDLPTELKPSYELWVERKEPWLAGLEGVEQHIGNKPGIQAT
jgi:hypothetical protein